MYRKAQDLSRTLESLAVVINILDEYDGMGGTRANLMCVALRPLRGDNICFRPCTGQPRNVR